MTYNLTLRFDSFDDRKKFLKQAKTVLYHYGFISIQDIHDLYGSCCASYSDSKQGWTDTNYWFSRNVFEDSLRPEFIIEFYNATSVMEIPKNVSKINTVLEIEEILKESKYSWEMKYDSENDSYHFVIK